LLIHSYSIAHFVYLDNQVIPCSNTQSAPPKISAKANPVNTTMVVLWTFSLNVGQVTVCISLITLDINFICIPLFAALTLFPDAMCDYRNTYNTFLLVNVQHGLAF